MLNFLNSRLSIALRVALIAACGAPPVALLLYLFVDQVHRQSAFTRLELEGAAYLSDVWPAILTGAPPKPPDPALHAAREAQAFEAAKGKDKPLAGLALIHAVADGSRLTLDTDLSSFYAMDAATVTLPRLMTTLVAADEAGPSDAVGQARVLEAAVVRDLGEAVDRDPTQRARTVLTPQLDQLGAAFAAFQSHPDSQPARTVLTGQIDRTWRATNSELIRMLQARQTRLGQQFAASLALIALTLGAALFLMVQTTRGLTRRLRDLLQTMDRLKAGDTTVEAPYQSDRNETGRIAATLEAFRRGLIEADEERRRTEAANAAVRESEAQLRFLTENMSDLIVRCGRDGVRLYVSPSVRRFGYEPEELIGGVGFSKGHPEDTAGLDALIELMARGETLPDDVVTQVRMETKSGEWVWMEGKPNLVRDADGQLSEIIWIMRDIQARKMSESALIDSEARYRMLADNSSDIIIHHDRDFRVQYISPSVRQFGYTPEQFRDVLSIGFVHPDDQAKTAERRRQALQGMPVRNLEARVHMADGSWRWSESTLTSILSDAGDITGFITTLRDIAERKAAEQALVESEARYRMLADHATDIIQYYDLDGVVQYMSPSVRQLGYEPEEFIGRVSGGIVHEDDRDEVLRRRAEVFSGKPARSVEARLRCANGDWVWIESSAAPVYDEAGKVTGIVSVIRNVSERKKAEAALQEVDTELRRVARASALGAFAASLAHEINQPLAAAVINSEASLRWLAQDPHNLERGIQAISRSLDNVRRASDVVAQLRAMVTKEEPKKVAFDANEAIREVLTLTERERERSHVKISPKLNGSPCTVHGDRIQFQQVMLNLVLNAIEAMREAPAEDRRLIVSCGPADHGGVEVSVEDRGPGISPDNLERIFENLFTTKIGGTGLGLAISRSIIAAHGGRLWVENVAPRGAVFRVSIPKGQESL